MAAVEAGDRDKWLASFTEDARVEDPVGHLPPVLGQEALSQFWDNAIGALESVDFEVTREWETADEAMLLATVTISMPDGRSANYDGAFNYAIDAQGKIASLRGFWDLPALGEALAAG